MPIIQSKAGKNYPKSNKFRFISLPLLPSQYDAVHVFVQLNKVGFTAHFRTLIDKDILENPEKYGLTKI